MSDKSGQSSSVKVFSILVGGLGLILIGSGASAGEFCEGRKEFLEPRIQGDGVSIEEILSAYVKESTVDVIVFGETHYEASQERQSELIRYIHSLDPRFNCVYIELSEEDLAFRRSLLGSVPRYSSSSLHIERRFFSSIDAQGIRFYGVDDRSGLDGVEDLLLSGEPIEDKALKEDLEKRVLTDRNRLMADNIKLLVDAKECDRGVLIVGKSHLFSVSDGVEVTPITDFLSGQGLGSRSVNIEDTVIHPLGPPMSSPALCFKDCPWNPDLPKEEIAFIHGDEGGRAAFVQESRFSSKATAPHSGFWGDFDATIVVSSGENSCESL